MVRVCVCAVAVASARLSRCLIVLLTRETNTSKDSLVDPFTSKLWTLIKIKQIKNVAVSTQLKGYIPVASFYGKLA